MSAPNLSWFDGENEAPVTSWELGIVDAGSVSPDYNFLLWNNRNGSEEVSDMVNCSITIKNDSGGNTGALVEDRWIEVRVDSMGESTFTPIGGEIDKEIEAGGPNTEGNQTISGTINDGSLNAEDNFCELTMHANVDGLASAGSVDFLVRVSYQYV